MTAVQPPLFLPGWEVEPCDTAPPPARVRIPRWMKNTVTVRIPIDQYPEGASQCQAQT
ncbi:hypothetical protein [Streptomyces sp. NPDC002889]|uniref:hypothetical protein n=1 Tax=Streptomyces sp. NPDC002889 TaxID=3364669 RepID=UPI0036AF1D54